MTVSKLEDNSSTPTIAIASGRELVRDAIAEKLVKNCDVNVVARLDDGYSAINTCVQLKPDILLLDMSIIRPSGAEVLERISRQNRDVKVIILATDTDFQAAVTTLSYGVIGFLPQQAKGIDYANAVQAAINGFAYWPIKHIKALLKSRPKLTRTGNIFGLSIREVEVLEACVLGKSAKDVAQQLNISVRTVQTHKYSIYKKTDSRDLSELTQIASSLNCALEAV